MRLRNALTTGLVEHLNPIKAKLLPFLAHGGGFGGVFIAWFYCFWFLLVFWGEVLSWGTRFGR